MLEDLDLEYNKMLGSIPNELGLMRLVQLGLGGNSFKGVLPESICHLDAVNGPACDLSGNDFSCPLPLCITGPSTCNNVTCR